MSKNSELDAKFRKLRRTCDAEDIVRDDSGNHAVFTERGSCITYDGSNSLRHCFKTARRHRASKRRCECPQHKKKKEDSLNLLRLLEAARPIDLDTAITVKTPEQLCFLKAQSSHQNAIFVVIRWQDY